MNEIKAMLQEQLDTLLSNELHLEVEQDEQPFNPRTDYSNAGIVCVKNSCKYLRNECVGFEFDNFTSLKQVMNWLKKEKGAIKILPLYVYDHSGVTINTTGFNTGYGNGWDTSLIGYYYATEQSYKEQISNNWDADNVKKVLLQEIWALDKYLSGEIYAWVIKNKLGKRIDSCGGYHEQEQALADGNELLKDLQKVYNDNLIGLKSYMIGIQGKQFMPV